MTQVVRVVPDVPSFAVDDGFAYSVADGAGRLERGRIVRVPLGGRTVRGYVVDPDASSDRKLREVKATTGRLPVFDDRLLQTLRWTALHYVAPLGPVLAKAAPPNVPAGGTRAPVGPIAPPASPLPELTSRVAAGGRMPPHALLRPVSSASIAGLAGEVLAAGRNVGVIVPTIDEATALAGSLPFDGRIHVASSQLPARESTRAWSTAQEHGGVVVVGTREIALWPLGPLGLVIVAEPGRRALKAQQTPTIRVGDVVRRRAAVEGFGLVYLGPVPPSEVVASGTRLVRPTGRVWPTVEVVDRRSADMNGVVAAPTRRALEATARSGKQAFVFVPRHRELLACSQCGEPRRCGNCGSAVRRSGECARCETAAGPCAQCGGSRFHPIGLVASRVVDDLRRSIDSVGPAGSGEAIEVGTERDLAAGRPIDVAVVLGLDGIALAPNYRADEEALRLTARVAGFVRPGSGRRCIVETSMPEDPVVRALVSGRPEEYMTAVVDDRGEAGLPPATELLVIELSGPPPEAATLQELQPGAATVMGPAPSRRGTRWLVQGTDLRPFRLALRSTVHEWREEGRSVRIDVDPIDL